jgi:hypothetical protein
MRNTEPVGGGGDANGAIGAVGAQIQSGRGFVRHPQQGADKAGTRANFFVGCDAIHFDDGFAGIIVTGDDAANGVFHGKTFSDEGVNRPWRPTP